MSRDRQQTVLASAARTATSNTQITQSGNGGIFIINVTAVTATPSVVFTVQGIDPVSKTAYTILASAAVTGTGTTTLRVFPGATAAANTVANDFLPENVNLLATHSDADSITYSIGFIGMQ